VEFCIFEYGFDFVIKVLACVLAFITTSGYINFGCFAERANI
jgi:hypothetical protein